MALNAFRFLSSQKYLIHRELNCWTNNRCVSFGPSKLNKDIVQEVRIPFLVSTYVILGELLSLPLLICK